MKFPKLASIILAGALVLGTPKILVAPTLPIYPPEMGINLSKFEAGDVSAKQISAIKELAEQGYKTMVLNPAYKQMSYKSSNVINKSNFSMSNLESIIDECKNLGIKTALKPLVNSKDNQSRTLFNPENLKEWESSYMTVIDSLSKVAISKDVDYFVVGTELSDIFDRDPSFFGSVSDSVKAMGFKGKTMYATEFSNLNDLKRIKVLNDIKLDAVGVDFYVSMEKIGAVAEYEPEYYIRKIKDFLPSKELYISEVGYRSVNGGNKWPMFDFRKRGTEDDSVQASSYRNFLRSAINLNMGRDMVKGIFLWVTNSSNFAEDFYTHHPTGYSIFNKPAEKVVEDFMREYSKTK